MGKKYSEWKQNQKFLHEREKIERKEIRLKWKRQKQDKAILKEIPIREDFKEINLTPFVTTPKSNALRG